MFKVLRFVLFTLLLAVSTNSLAQKKVTVKGGTIVPLEAVKEVRGAQAHEGEYVDFRVTQDVKVDGVVAIPKGTIAKGMVTEAKRSMAFGTRGRLGIKIRSLTVPSGDVINFASSEVYIKGSNRTALSVIIFCFTCLPFPSGGKAVMKAGYETDATVATNTTITIE